MRPKSTEAVSEEFFAVRFFPRLLQDYNAASIRGNKVPQRPPPRTMSEKQTRTVILKDKRLMLNQVGHSKNGLQNQLQNGTMAIQGLFQQGAEELANGASSKPSMLSYRPTQESCTLSALREKIRLRSNKANKLEKKSKQPQFRASVKNVGQNQVHARPFRPVNTANARAAIGSPRGLLSKTPHDDNGGKDVKVQAAERIARLRQKKGGCKREWRQSSVSIKHIDTYLNSDDAETTILRQQYLNRMRRLRLVNFNDSVRVRNATARKQALIAYLERCAARTGA